LKIDLKSMTPNQQLQTAQKLEALNRVSSHRQILFKTAAPLHACIISSAAALEGKVVRVAAAPQEPNLSQHGVLDPWERQTQQAGNQKTKLNQQL
jgi:hypothetical protein